MQYAPALFRRIKQDIDQQRNLNGRYLLTGSQNYALMQALSDSLAGRVAIIPMLGLSGQEWRASAVSQGHDWTHFLLRGGYPGLWAHGEVSRARWYQSYVATYLERDVRNLLRVTSLRDFERFIRACAARCAQTLNMSDLGRDVGISSVTAREWINVLVASNQVMLLEPYHRSLGKRLVKSPKLYFTDTGLAAHLMGLDEAVTPPPTMMGALWENHVISQWLRWRDLGHADAMLWYWRDQQGNEVDLLVEWRGRMHAIECKYRELPNASDLHGIRKLRAFYTGQDIPACIACTTRHRFTIADEVIAVSGWTAWGIA